MLNKLVGSGRPNVMAAEGLVGASDGAHDLSAGLSRCEIADGVGTCSADTSYHREVCPLGLLEAAGEDPVGTVQHLLDLRQVGRHQDDHTNCIGQGVRGIVPDRSDLDEVVVLRAAPPGDVNGGPTSEDVGSHRATHYPETDDPRRGGPVGWSLRHGVSVA